MDRNFVNDSSKSAIINFQTQVLKTYSDIVNNLVNGEDIEWGDDNRKEPISMKEQIEINKNNVLLGLKMAGIGYILKEDSKDDTFKYVLRSDPNTVRSSKYTCKIFNGVEDFINSIKNHLASDRIIDYILYMPFDFIRDEKIFYKLVIDTGKIEDVNEQFQKLKDILTCKNAVRDAVLSYIVYDSSTEPKDVIEKYQKMLISDENNVITNLEDVLNQIDKDLGGK